MNQNKKKFLANLVVIIVAIVLMSVIGHSGGNQALTVTATAEYVRLTGSEDFLHEVRYEDIQKIELLNELEHGVPAGGVETKDFRYGCWENETYGVYVLGVTKKATQFIEITTDAGVTVLNMEGDEPTESLYYAIEQEWKEIHQSSGISDAVE